MKDDALMCFPTRVDWEMAKPPADLEKFPAPLVTSNDGQEDALVHPGPVDALAEFARTCGWETKITYAEGWVPHAKLGTPLGPKALWAVRMRRGTVRAVAVRTDGTWTSLWKMADTWQRFTTLGSFQEAIR
jgi:hypothetical protein